MGASEDAEKVTSQKCDKRGDAGKSRQVQEPHRGDEATSGLTSSGGKKKRSSSPNAKSDNDAHPKKKKQARTSDKRRGGNQPRKADTPTRFAAVDLGTNNCRLLIAAPRGKNLRIIDAYSEIVRLGEGVSRTQRLSDDAMERTRKALKVCAAKISQRNVKYVRCIATQACRSAKNGEAFLASITEETGLEFEIIDAAEEARLAVAGCYDLLDEKSKAALIFDIGGGSTELSWLKRNDDKGSFETLAWTSLPVGVVSLAETYDGASLTDTAYNDIVDEVHKRIKGFKGGDELRPIFADGKAHLLGTSGTVTSIAGVHLGLKRYRRDKVDGVWLDVADAHAVTERLRAMNFEERAEEPCIGRERADLVVCGCAILDAIQREWPVSRIRVADRGLREGVLSELAAKARKSRRKSRNSSSRRKKTRETQN